MKDETCMETINAWEFAKVWHNKRDMLIIEKPLVDITGNFTSAIVLSRIVYWSKDSENTNEPRMRIERDGKLWMARARDDWWEECRIKSKTAARAIDCLVKMGLVEKKIFKFNGMSTTHLRLNKEKYGKILMKTLQNIQNKKEKKKSPPDKVSKWTKCPKGSGQNGHSHIQVLHTSTTDDYFSNDLEKERRAGRPSPIVSEDSANEENSHEKEMGGESIPSIRRKTPAAGAGQVELLGKEMACFSNPDYVNHPRFLARWEEWLRATGLSADSDKAVAYCAALKRMGVDKAVVHVTDAAFAESQRRIIAGKLRGFLEKTRGKPLSGAKENGILEHKISAGIVKFWRERTSGTPNSSGTSRFYFPKPEALAETFVMYLEEHYGNWKDIHVMCLVQDSKIWKDFVEDTKNRFNWMQIFDG